MVENQGEDKISEAVQNVVRDSGSPVGESGARPPGYQVGEGAERAKQKAEETGNDSPENGGIHLLEHEDDKSQNAPNI